VKKYRGEKSWILACGLRFVWEALLWSFFHWVALRFREITYAKNAFVSLCYDKPSRYISILCYNKPTKAFVWSRSQISIYYNKGSVRRDRTNFDNLKNRWKLTSRNVYKLKNVNFRSRKVWLNVDFTVTRDGKNVSLRKGQSYHFKQRTSFQI